MAKVKVAAYAQNTQAILNNNDLKDEFVCLIVNWPVIQSFWGVSATEGFEALAVAPQWYMWTVTSIDLAIFGIKPLALKVFRRGG